MKEVVRERLVGTLSPLWKILPVSAVWCAEQLFISFLKDAV